MSETTNDDSGPARSTRRLRRRMKTIQSWEDVPAFSSEGEEAEFWATHALGNRLLSQMQPIPSDQGGELPPVREPGREARTRPVSVRLDEDLLRRLRMLAERKQKGYQTLLKQFVVERVYEEEKREGLI